MITEDYVSLETAKLLKEKGFDEKCMSYYGHGEFHLGSPKYMKSNTDRDGVACNGVAYDAYNAPTLQMALKWLRKEHNLGVIPYWSQVSGEFGCRIYDLTKKGNQEYHSIRGSFDGFEEPTELGVKYCLENLI